MVSEHHHGAPPDAQAPRHAAYSTDDPDEAQAFIGRMYAARPGRASGSDASPGLRLREVSAGELSLVDLTLPPRQTFALDGTSTLTVSIVLSGLIEFSGRGRVRGFGRGQVYLGSWPGSEYVVECHRLRVGALSVPADVLARAGAVTPDLAPHPLRFASMEPVSAAAARQWRRAAAYARDVLLDDAVATSPLVLEQTARLLGAAVLAAFPHDLEPPGRSSSAGAVAVRRAEEFVHARAHTAIGPTDIARAASVTPQALDLAFRRHRDTTTERHLAGVRLARAHDDLVRGDPDDGDTVGAIAARWGFAGLAAFVDAYGAAYGRHPGVTLRATID